MPPGDGQACEHRPGLNPISLSGFVYVATMADPENEDYQMVVANFVDDAVVACSHAPFARPADKLNRFGWPWISRQEFDRCLNSASNLWVELVQLPFCRRRDRD
jgi:hypothetical protein